MPSPKRQSPQDFFDRLEDHQRPHLLRLREISLGYAPAVAETLHWNTPAYLSGKDRLWMLQAFAKHCSLRFTPDFFASWQDEAAAAGQESGAGFLKLPYDREIPEDLCRRLIEAKLAEHGIDAG
ncbi:iron chaperone [Kocuria palustris]|uniref:iron chaperone n=1 Tax=Kocuria palustris TaxID=71999 RepID=UPI00119F58F7|nr:DUF1801 domain-containing protein [Kocuria palustris]